MAEYPLFHRSEGILVGKGCLLTQFAEIILALELKVALLASGDSRSTDVVVKWEMPPEG